MILNNFLMMNLVCLDITDRLFCTRTFRNIGKLRTQQQSFTPCQTRAAAWLVRCCWLELALLFYIQMIDMHQHKQGAKCITQTMWDVRKWNRDSDLMHHIINRVYVVCKSYFLIIDFCCLHRSSLISASNLPSYPSAKAKVRLSHSLSVQ